MDNYIWYKIIDGEESLSQGDIIKSCPIITPPPNMKLDEMLAEIVEVDVFEHNVVIMSQSCDLEYKKIKLVLVCPVVDLGEFENRSKTFKGKNKKELVKNKNKLRMGVFPGYHLLNKSEIEGFETDYLIVDFHNVYGVPFDFLIEFSKKTQRLRLLPPYKEHLSQAFARFFMRVGLPLDIPKFKK